MSIFTVFLKNRNFISKTRRSKVADYAALIACFDKWTIFTVVLFIYLFIYLIIHIHVFIHNSFIHMRICSYGLKYFCNVEMVDI